MNQRTVGYPSTSWASCGDWQGGYDQADFPDVIILLKVIVSFFSEKKDY